MAVKIRLARKGRKKLALYDIVAADARAPRDGRFIEKLGSYNPHTHPATVLVKTEKTLQWLSYGAQPTHTVRNILSSRGILLKRHLQLGLSKGAITQAAVEKRWESWENIKKNNSSTELKETTQEIKVSKNLELEKEKQANY